MKQEKSLSSLYQKRNRLRKKLANYGYILRGSVVVLNRPCSYEKCKKCESGERHPATYLSFSHKGKTQIQYIPVHMRETTTEWTNNYRELQTVIEEIVALNREILRLKGKK